MTPRRAVDVARLPLEPVGHALAWGLTNHELAPLALCIELIARQPSDQIELRSRLYSELIPKHRQLCRAREIHLRGVFIARLVITAFYVFALLRVAPG